MLQGTAKEYLWAMAVSIALCSVFLNCKNQTSILTEDEATYLADYEVPENKWGFLNASGEVVINADYDDVEPFSEGLAAVNLNGRWGYIDLQGKTVISPVYKSAWAFHENKARVQPFGQPAGFIDRQGKFISSPLWVPEDDFSEGLARVKVGSNYGYIDSLGNLKIQPVYSRNWNFKQGLAKIEIDEKIGVINQHGEEILPPQFDQITFSEGIDFILCKKGTTSVIFTRKGEEYTHVDGVLMESDGALLSVRQNGKMYFFNLQQKKPLESPAYETIIYLGDHHWAGKKDTLYFLLDDQGKILTSRGYHQINRYSEGIAASFNGVYWNYIDAGGKELAGDIFGLAWDYKEGMARAAFKDGIAFIDRRQRLAFYLPSGTLDVRDFSQGLAPVQLSAK